ncbi:patatin-like phospholipase family protein [Mariniluteicoccus flavus]
MRAAVALGSGGARGYAHIGALSVLEERGHTVEAVAGTSMGALVGGLYAAGRLDQFEEWARSLTQRDVLLLMDPALVGPGVIKAERVLAKVRDILAGAQIEDLAIPFTAVATDLHAHREVWFQRGPVDAAIRASIAIPSVITPVVINGRVLVDGGVLNPVPIDPVIGAAADFTMAVSLSGERRDRARGPVKATSEPRDDEEWFARFRRGLTSIDLKRIRRSAVPLTLSALRLGDDALGEHEIPYEPYPAGMKTSDVVNHSLEAVEEVITRFRLAANPPDVMVSIPSDACRTMDFHRAVEMIELGRTAAVEAFDRAGL